MIIKKAVVIAMALSLSGIVSAKKFDGIAMTPPMGWNTWNTFNCNINEKLVRETAEAMISSGMRDAGYVYIVLDDCWLTKERNAEGNLVGDPAKFPSGMKALGDFLHSRGFKFGIYNCAGTKTCAGYPGGRGHEYQDASLYASWGVDYLKYDWCNSGKANAWETYRTMRDALYKAGRPIVFSMCEWGTSKPWKWAPAIAHLWRTTGDITDCWNCKPKNSWEHSIKNLLDQQVGLEKYAGPGGWNDPDMLEVGNDGLTLAESRTHFSMWCMLAAPLMAGNDIRIMTDEVKAILTDTEVIAIDQDPLGRQGYRLSREPNREVWVKELSDGNWAVCVLNAGDKSARIKLSWKELTFLKSEYKVRDLWEKKNLGTTKKDISRMVEPHDVILIRLTPTGQK